MLSLPLFCNYLLYTYICIVFLFMFYYILLILSIFTSLVLFYSIDVK